MLSVGNSNAPNWANLLHCNYEIFYFLNSLQPFQKYNLLHNTILLWNQSFLNHHNKFSAKTFLSPHFGKWVVCHDITKSDGSEANNESSAKEIMTEEFYKKNCQKTYLPNVFRFAWRQKLVPSLPSRNKYLVIAVKNYTEVNSTFPSRVQFFLFSSLCFKYVFQNWICLLLLEWTCHCECQL